MGDCIFCKIANGEIPSVRSLILLKNAPEPDYISTTAI
jgi:hypothetical protein